MWSTFIVGIGFCLGVLGACNLFLGLKGGLGVHLDGDLANLRFIFRLLVCGKGDHGLRVLGYGPRWIYNCKLIYRFLGWMNNLSLWPSE